MRNPLDIYTLNSVTKLPTRPMVPPLSEQLANFKSQQAYIESLNLREVCFTSFNTLQDSLKSIQKHFDPENPLKDDFNNYTLLSDVTQQRNFLNNFNQNFRRVVNHVLELSTFMASKE